MINLRDYVARDRIAFLQARDKQDALAKLISLSDDPRHVIDFDQFQNAVLDREYIVTTGIGPEHLALVIGATAKRSVPDGEGIEWEDIV